MGQKDVVYLCATGERLLLAPQRFQTQQLPVGALDQEEGPGKRYLTRVGSKGHTFYRP